MVFRLDAQLRPVLDEMTRNAPPAPAVHDWQAIRDNVASAYTALRRLVARHDEVVRTEVTFSSTDGVELSARWFAPPGSPRGSAAVFAHGGGMIAGDVDLFDPYVASYAAQSGVPILSVDYRLAPEATGTSPVEDVYSAFVWLAEHADEHGVDPRRIALMGESAGAGLAAGAAILARDDGRGLARQILIYPMLDDRTDSAPPALAPFLTWTVENNETGWTALLGDLLGTDAVPPHVAPGRLTDHAGLAPLYVEVGELDLFRDEAVAYCQRSWRAGVSTELHVRPGAVHGFDQYLPSATISRRDIADRVHALADL